MILWIGMCWLMLLFGFFLGSWYTGGKWKQRIWDMAEHEHCDRIDRHENERTYCDAVRELLQEDV